MADEGASLESLEASVRAQLFKIQLSIVDAHEEVLAVVREHVGGWGQERCKQQRRPREDGHTKHDEGTPPKPPDLPRLPPEPPAPSEICERPALDSGLFKPNGDHMLEEIGFKSLYSIGTSPNLAPKANFMGRANGRPTSATSSVDKSRGCVAPQDAEQALSVPGSMPGLEGKEDLYKSEGTSQTPLKPDDEKSSESQSLVDVSSLKVAKFELLPMWLSDGAMEARGSLKAAMQLAKSGYKSSSTMADLTAAQDCSEFMDYLNLEEKLMRESEDKTCQRAIHPHSAYRGSWDLCSLAFVIYDMIFIPLQLFDIAPNGFTAVISWATRLFWTGDIFASFVTGHVREDGSYELHLRRIGRRYLTSWFALDVAIVFADWCEIFWDASGGAGYARMGKATRVLRIVRMVRLLRLVRMQMLIKLIIERINSERLSILANIIRLITAIAGFAHIMACVWYGISVSTDSGWVHYYDKEHESLGLRYAVSLHWAFSQFAGGMDEYVPKNLDERVFAIHAFLLAFMLSGLFISSLTSSMTQLTMISSYYSQRLSSLRKYMNQNGISKRLAMRVQRNAAHALREQQKYVPEDQVVALTLVSEPLRAQVHFEMYSQIASRHPFFERYIEECPQVMRKVAHRAMSMLSVSPGDVIFSPGEIALQPRMFFICGGTLQYISASAIATTVEDRTWISEAVIWTHWMHRGQLTALRECRLCALEAPVFQHIVGRFEHPDFDPRAYAAAFVHDLNSHVIDVVDLPSDNFNYADALGAAKFTEGRGRSTGRMSIVKGAMGQLGF